MEKDLTNQAYKEYEEFHKKKKERILNELSIMRLWIDDTIKFIKEDM